MKKRIILASILTLFMIGVLPGMSSALIEVPSYGETGWQTFSETLDEGFLGWVGIGVSDESDSSVNSLLLIDNINFGPASNPGFETGNFTGYTLNGTGSVVSTYTSFWGNGYSPTEGSMMALLDTEPGTSTDFLDPYLFPPIFQSDVNATDGTWIEFWVDLDAGDTVSFDWMFDTTDYWDLEDFAFLYARNEGETELDFVEILAKIGPTAVPEPATLLLLGAGLFGLSAYGRRKLKK